MVNEVMNFITGYDKEVGEAFRPSLDVRGGTWN